MSSPDVFSATLQFGDVVEIGHPDIESGEINWREHRVVMGVYPTHLELSQIVEDEVLLTTIGTEWGVVRLVEETERWTPTQAAIAMVEGLWGQTEQERVENDFEVLRIIAGSINQLRNSLIEEAEKGPTVYTYTQKTKLGQ